MSYRRLRTRLEELDRRLPVLPISEGSHEMKRRRQVAQRLVRLIKKAIPLFTEEEDEKVAGALAQWCENGMGPYRRWLGELFRGTSRLPELAPESMKQLLLAWLSQECAVFMPVCRGCGLMYPHHRSPPLNEWKLLPGKTPRVGPPPWYDLPEFFSSCPGCRGSSSDFDWSHLLGGVNRPWMALDGYVGPGVDPGLACSPSGTH